MIEIVLGMIKEREIGLNDKRERSHCVVPTQLINCPELARMWKVTEGMGCCPHWKENGIKSSVTLSKMNS